MTFLEKDLEQIIYESGMDLLIDKGLFIDGKRYRQVRIGNYGIADLITITKPTYYGKNRKKIQKGIVTVFELKKEKIGLSAFLQAVNYARGIQLYLEKRNKLHLYDIHITLVGKEVDLSGSLIYLTDLLSMTDFQLNYYRYHLNINGLVFIQESEYQLKDNGF